jgi:ribosomal protein L7/L12
MGELLLVLLPAIVLVALIWGLFTALSPRDAGMSDAEKYQRDLAERSARHYAAQVEAATAARARLEAKTRPSQNTQQHTQQQDHARMDMLNQAATAGSGHNGLMPAGGAQLNHQLAMQLQAMVRSGQKVQAIKLLRQATQSDLATAKKYIERL